MNWSTQLEGSGLLATKNNQTTCDNKTKQTVAFLHTLYNDNIRGYMKRFARLNPLKGRDINWLHLAIQV